MYTVSVVASKQILKMFTHTQNYAKYLNINTYVYTVEHNTT